MNTEEMKNFMNAIDLNVPPKSNLYRHLMSKPEGVGRVYNKSYVTDSNPIKIMERLYFEWHHYYTLALFKDPSKRTKREIVATSGLYVDIDEKESRIDGKVGYDLILYAIEKAKLPEPSIVVHTGGGWHLYWLFQELYYFDDPKDLEIYEATIASIINCLSLIGADPKAKDATRLLRIPGTFNPKAEYNNPRVSLVALNNSRYSIGDFKRARVVKTLPNGYNLKQANKQAKTAVKVTLTKDESKAIKQPVDINQTLTRPKGEFPMHLIGDIITQAQSELEKRTSTARFMAQTNQSIIVDLLVNYVNLPRNTYTFSDGTSGQYVQIGNRNHYLWSLARRGVTYEHLALINSTLLLPSLNQTEFQNAVNVGKKLKTPRIAAMVSDLSLTLAEQSVMTALRVDYETLLEKQEITVRTRINSIIKESHQELVLANKGKKATILADELDIAVSSVYRYKKQKGGEYRMNKEEKAREITEMYTNVERTGRIALEELYADYHLAGETLDRIIRNQSLIHSLGYPLSQEQQEEIKALAESIVAKVEFITSQIDAYSEFVLDDSEFFNSGKIKKSVLMDKVNKLKQSVSLVTQ